MAMGGMLVCLTLVNVVLVGLMSVVLTVVVIRRLCLGVHRVTAPMQCPQLMPFTWKMITSLPLEMMMKLPR